MKRILLVFTLFLGIFFAAQAAVPDSIVRKMTLLAARDDTEALRPLYRQYGAQLVPSARLFCNLAFARERHDDRRLLECVDSLLEEYPRTLPVNTRYTLSVVKAGALVHLQEFAELQSFCTREMKRYRNRRKYRTQYQTLDYFRTKARRLLDSVSVRGRVMRLVEADDALGLRAYADSLGALDSYACRMPQLTMLWPRWPTACLPARPTLSTARGASAACVPGCMPSSGRDAGRSWLTSAGAGSRSARGFRAGCSVMPA